MAKADSVSVVQSFTKRGETLSGGRDLRSRSTKNDSSGRGRSGFEVAAIRIAILTFLALVATGFVLLGDWVLSRG